MVLCIFPVVLATQDEIVTWDVGKNVTLNTLCSNENGVLCNGSASCNVSVYYPNWTINYTEKAMSYQGDGFFETNLSSYTEEGDYKSLISCNFGGYIGVSRGDFRIISINIVEEFKMIAIVMIMAGLIGMFIYIGIKGKEYITNIDWLKEFIGFVAVNIALILIPITIGMAIKIFENSAIVGVLDGLYIASWWIMGTIILVNLIINLWSFIPLMWSKTTKILENW